MSEADSRSVQDLVATGIWGLDSVLGGGFSPNRVYLVQGGPGAGKTTLAIQFLLEAVRRKEPCLYVALSESPEELADVARSHGWSLDGIHVFALSVAEEALKPDLQYTMYHPSEVELAETTRAIIAQVENLKPTRVVFDSLSEMRLLAQNPVRYRRQVLGLKQFFVGRQCTVLLLDDVPAETPDLQLESLVHGVVGLEQLSPEYGAERRRLRIVKMRGIKYRGGWHDFIIRTGGLDVFPRLIAAEHVHGFESGQVSSGVPELDQLLGGGLDRGTSVLLMGPAGSGKSSVAMQYAAAAAARGEPAAVFTFDESTQMLLVRCRALGIDLQAHVDSGRIRIQQIDPAEMSPGQFAHEVRRCVENFHARILVIDSLNGYLNAMPEERYLTMHLHELLTYLGQQGVVTFLVVAQHGLVGSSITAPVDASYLADTVILLRYFESEGRVRLAVAVVKKRSGRHERTIRELVLTSSGITVSQPLDHLYGILSGTPWSNSNGFKSEAGKSNVAAS